MENENLTIRRVADRLYNEALQNCIDSNMKKFEEYKESTTKEINRWKEAYNSICSGDNKFGKCPDTDDVVTLAVHVKLAALELLKTTPDTDADMRKKLREILHGPMSCLYASWIQAPLENVAKTFSSSVKILDDFSDTDIEISMVEDRGDFVKIRVNVVFGYGKTYSEVISVPRLFPVARDESSESGFIFGVLCHDFMAEKLSQVFFENARNATEPFTLKELVYKTVRDIDFPNGLPKLVGE